MADKQAKDRIILLIDACWCCGADVVREVDDDDDKLFEPIYCERCQ